MKNNIKKSIIVAMTENNAIGLNNQLPWHIPEDLAYFKEKTLNKIIVMGRKTFESIGRSLPKRLNVVLTKNKEMMLPKEVLVFSSLKKALGDLEQYDLNNEINEIMIIGGGEIYKEALNFVDRLYVTLIHKNLEGDVFFPEIDLNKWKKTSEIKGIGVENCDYSFLIYERK